MTPEEREARAERNEVTSDEQSIGVNPRHAHEEWDDPIPVVLRADGGCAVCGLVVERDRARKWADFLSGRIHALNDEVLAALAASP